METLPTYIDKVFPLFEIHQQNHLPSKNIIEYLLHCRENSNTQFAIAIVPVLVRKHVPQPQTVCDEQPRVRLIPSTMEDFLKIVKKN